MLQVELRLQRNAQSVQFRGREVLAQRLELKGQLEQLNGVSGGVVQLAVVLQNGHKVVLKGHEALQFSGGNGQVLQLKFAVQLEGNGQVEQLKVDVQLHV